MLICVKYALDAQNNVGIFSAELNPGDMTIVFREEKDGQQYQASLINENGVLFIRIVDPSRELRGEAAKIRKPAQMNEVFSIGSATVMIMSIQSPENAQNSAVKSQPEVMAGKEITGISDEITDIPNPGGAKTSPLAAPPPIIPVPRAAKPSAIPPNATPKPVGLPDPDFKSAATSSQSNPPIPLQKPVPQPVPPVVGANALKLPPRPGLSVASEPNPVIDPPKVDNQVAAPDLKAVPPPVSAQPQEEEEVGIELPLETEELEAIPFSSNIDVPKSPKPPAPVRQVSQVQVESLEVEKEEVHQLGLEENLPEEMPALETVPMPEVGEVTAASLNIALAKENESSLDPIQDSEPVLQSPQEMPTVDDPELTPSINVKTSGAGKPPTLPPPKPIPRPTSVKPPAPPAPEMTPIDAKENQTSSMVKENAKNPSLTSKGGLGNKPIKPPPGGNQLNPDEVRAKILKSLSGGEGDDTFSKRLKKNIEKEIDPNALPSVDGSRLNFNPQFSHGNNPLPEGADREDSKTGSKRLEVPKPRSRAQLFTEDVRDRRVYVKGAKYSIRNKLAALLLVLGVSVISIYSLGISAITDKTQEWLIADSVKAQVLLRAQEYISRLRHHHYLVGSILSFADFEKLDQPTISKAYASAEPILSIGVFRYITAATVEAANNTPPATLPKLLPVKAVVTEVPTPRYDVAHLIKLPDGNYLEPVVQWVREIEARALDLEFGTVVLDQTKRITDAFASKVTPGVFDYRDLTMPKAEKGVYTYVVRASVNSSFFVVVQTSYRYFSEVFTPQSDMDFFLFHGKKTLLLPENARKIVPVIEQITEFLNGTTKEPSSSNGYTYSQSINSHVDLVGRPNQFKIEMFSSDVKSAGIFGLVILLAFLAAGIWFSKKITLPLFTLVKQIETVAAGDYHTRFDVDANDEIGQVCDYFEHLSGTLRRKENELARVTDLAKKDSLTGLYNHSYFRSQLETKWKEIEAKGGSAILIDIDDFRMFNHAHGHIQGDLILKDIALGIQEVVKTGICARYGGEEFVVWSPGFDQKAAFELAENIQKKIRSLKTPSLTGGTPFTVSCSLGVTNFVKGKHNNIDQFLRDADSNLSMAKKAGKNRIWAGAA